MSQPKQGNYFMLPNEIFNMDLTAEEIGRTGKPSPAIRRSKRSEKH